MFDIKYDFPYFFELAKAKKRNHTQVYLVRGQSAYHYISVHQQIFFDDINLKTAKALVGQTINIAKEFEYKNQDLLFECINNLPENLLHYFRKFPTFLDIATGHIKVTPRSIAYLFLYTFVHRGLRGWSCKKEMRIMTTRELMINNPKSTVALFKSGNVVKGVLWDTLYSVICVDLMFDDHYYDDFLEFFKEDLVYIWPLVKTFRARVTPFLLLVIMEKLFDIYRGNVWNNDVVKGLRSIFPHFNKLLSLRELSLNLSIYAKIAIYTKSHLDDIKFLKKMRDAVLKVKKVIHEKRIS